MLALSATLIGPGLAAGFGELVASFYVIGCCWGLVDVLANAQAKLARKRLDLIVANDVGAPGVGFEHDTNEVVIVGSDGIQQRVPMANKLVIADAILDEVVRRRRSDP